MQVKLYLYRSGMQCKSPWFAVFIRNRWLGICQVRSLSITIEREGTLPKASCGGDSRKPNKSMRHLSWSPAHNSHTFYLGRLQEFPFEVKIFENFSLLNSWQISCVFQLLQQENWTLQSYFKYLLVQIQENEKFALTEKMRLLHLVRAKSVGGSRTESTGSSTKNDKSKTVFMGTKFHKKW